MEDLLYILLMVGFFAVSVVSNKRRQQQRAEAEEAEIEPQIPEMWPTTPQSAPEPSKPRKTALKRAKRQGSAMHPDSQETITSELHAPRAPKQRIQAHIKSGQPTKPSLPIEEEAPQHPLTADFDARKAVIWAEIMKPKFEEE